MPPKGSKIAIKLKPKSVVAVKVDTIKVDADDVDNDIDDIESIDIISSTKPISSKMQLPIIKTPIILKQQSPIPEPTFYDNENNSNIDKSVDNVDNEDNEDNVDNVDNEDNEDNVDNEDNEDNVDNEDNEDNEDTNKNVLDFRVEHNSLEDNSLEEVKLLPARKAEIITNPKISMQHSHMKPDMKKKESEILIDSATKQIVNSKEAAIIKPLSTNNKAAKSTHQHSKHKTIVASKQTESSFDMFGDDDVDFRYIMMNYDYTKNKTLPKITKYERTLLIGKRAKQIEEGANPNVKVLAGQSAIEIAEEELRQRKIPLIIKRPIGNTHEYWKPADMEVFMD